MAQKELEITTNTYIFAGIGAVILGGLASVALGGIPNTIAAAVVGALAGGCLELSSKFKRHSGARKVSAFRPRREAGSRKDCWLLFLGRSFRIF